MPAPATGGALVPPRSAVDSSKLNLRLKETFREHMSWFREAVYLLTGYKVDMMTAGVGAAGASGAGGASGGAGGQLRLRSMFAEREDDALLFAWSPPKSPGARGTLELLETPYAARLDRKIFAYLTTCNSVPAFLSSVTLDLFEKQTFVGT